MSDSGAKFPAAPLYQDNEPFKLDLKHAVYAVDSTTIDLCLSLFPWAKFRKNKGAVKLHTQLNLKTLLPKEIDITDGLCHDVNILDRILFELNSIYVLDRGMLILSGCFPSMPRKRFLSFERRKICGSDGSILEMLTKQQECNVTKP